MKMHKEEKRVDITAEADQTRKGLSAPEALYREKRNSKMLDGKSRE